MTTAYELALMVLDGDVTAAKTAAQAIVTEHEKTLAEQRTQRARQEEEAQAFMAYRAKRDALLAEHGAALGKTFRAAGRHLGGNGYRWGKAVRRALLAPGMSDTGWTMQLAVTRFVEAAIGVDNSSYNSKRPEKLHAPDAALVEEFCTLIRTTKNAHHETGA